jgi:hypothetical protein
MSIESESQARKEVKATAGNVQRKTFSLASILYLIYRATSELHASDAEKKTFLMKFTLLSKKFFSSFI